MDQKEAIELLKSEKEVVALDAQSYCLFLSLGLALLHRGVWPIATITKGYKEAEDGCRDHAADTQSGG
jgi:hypothetical protein